MKNVSLQCYYFQFDAATAMAQETDKMLNLRQNADPARTNEAVDAKSSTRTRRSTSKSIDMGNKRDI
jgi:hypothetical protein